MKRKWILFSIAAIGALASGGVARAEDAHWVATWSASPEPGGRGNPPGFANQTIREIVRTSIGGRAVRIRISNVFGTAPLSIGAAHLALRSSGQATVPGSDRVLTFSGQESSFIQPGALVVSDPVNLDVAPLSDLAISIYLPGPAITPLTAHSFSLTTNYTSAPGNFTAAPEMPLAPTQFCFVVGPRPCITPWFFITSVEILASKRTAAIVAFGDSITDGDQAQATAGAIDANASWPGVLARRLQGRRGNHRDVAVVNEGIAGNRILSNSTVSQSAQARLDRDVLVQSGAKWIVFLEGINDSSNTVFVADQLIAADLQIIERAHALGLKVYGATLTPAGASGNESTCLSVKPPACREYNRATLNQWIRTSGAFDAVIDFDAVMRDPNNPTSLLQQYDNGDHLHPNSAGYQAMASAIDLSLFEDAHEDDD